MRTRRLCVLALTAVAAMLLPPSVFSADKAAPQKVVVSWITFNKIPENIDDVNNAINQYILKTYPTANVAIDLQLYGPADYNQKINLSLASGSPMDIFDPVPLAAFVANRQLLPLESLIDKYGQGIKQMLDRDFGPGALKATVFNDHLYSLPVNKGMALHVTLCYDKDLLALAGYTEKDINSIRDLPKVFDALKAKKTDVIPFAPINSGDTQLLRYLSSEHEIDVLSDAVTYAGVIFRNSGKVVNLYESKEFADGVKMMRDWYTKGYLPKDAATSQTIAQQYFSAGRLFCTIGGYGGNQAGVALSAMSGRNIGTKHLLRAYFNTQSINFVTTAIASNTKVPEAAMKVLNMVYTDEFVINTMLYGIEGRDYVKVDGHHWKYPNGKDANTVPYTAALCTGVFGSESLQLQPEGMSWDDILLKLRDNKETKRSPYFGFTFDPSNLKNEIGAITNVYNQYVPGLICGSLDPDTTIPKLNKALKDAGISTVIDQKQEQLDAWLKKNR
jgi:putative aldouronate transport system substrate-binding protein